MQDTAMRVPFRLGAVFSLLLVALWLSPLLVLHVQTASFNYADALSKSILFFEQQRSGRLPANQRATWRGNAALNDGKDVGVDLSGGYFDSGDNVKFGLPLGFALSTLAWGIVEFSSELNSQGQLQHALEALKWGTDYLINAHPSPNIFYGQVGEGNSDHSCWQRPEDMTTPRPSFRLDASHPGTEVAAEAAAALAAASVAFASSNRAYSTLVLNHARQLFDFADQHRGSYVNSIPDAKGFYNSYTGYNDELLWAATWLLYATSDEEYMNYVVNNGGNSVTASEFSWDNKNAGAQILAAKLLWTGRAVGSEAAFGGLKDKAVGYICSTFKYSQKTPGGLLFVQPWSSLQYASSASLALSIFADLLDTSGQSVQCGGSPVSPSDLRLFVKRQVDYILGDNPNRFSYMVGFGPAYPLKVHHRGASMPSFTSSSAPIGCQAGFNYYNLQSPNLNTIVGAVVGGPNDKDGYTDSRQNYQQNEPSLYINAPLVGALARVAAGSGSIQRGGGGRIPPVIRRSPAVPSRGSPRRSPARRSPARRSPARRTPPVKRPSPRGGSGKSLYIEVQVATSWVEKGVKMVQYSVNIKNISGKTISSYKLSATNFHPKSKWGITKLSDGRWTSLSYGSKLYPNQIFNFGFTQSGPPPTFSESGIVF